MKNKVIVFDGMPCTGKSTILKNIDIPNKFYDNGKVRHKNIFDKPYADEVLIDRINTLIEFISMTDLGMVVIDRLTASEFVFGKLIRNYNTNCIFDIEEQLAELVDLHVILFIDNVENVQQRMIKRDGKLRYTDDYMQLVRDQFIDWKNKTSLHLHIIDISQFENWGAVEKSVQTYIQLTKESRV